jgi:tetratricopeptide (TPR) repeat protein
LQRFYRVPGVLEEAVATYRLALQEMKREQVPLQWAMTQLNLGAALWALGERETGTGSLEEAVAAFRLAQQEMTRERVPLDWARTQLGLGYALSVLGEREAGTERLEEAVAAWNMCLTVIESALPQEMVQSVRRRRDEVQAEIARRASK